MVVVEVRQGTLGVDGRGWGPTENTVRRGSWLKSGREQEERRRGEETRRGEEKRGEEEEEDEKREEKEEDEDEEDEEEATDIKSNNPHLAGGEKWQLRLVKQQASRVGTEEARTCEAWFQLTFRPQKWNLKAHMWYQLSPSLAPMRRLQCSTTQATFTNPSLLRATPLLRGMF